MGFFHRWAAKRASRVEQKRAANFEPFLRKEEQVLQNTPAQDAAGNTLIVGVTDSRLIWYHLDDPRHGGDVNLQWLSAYGANRESFTVALEVPPLFPGEVGRKPTERHWFKLYPSRLSLQVMDAIEHILRERGVLENLVETFRKKYVTGALPAKDSWDTPSS